MKLITCVSCRQERPHKARGLCATCYQREYRRENPSPSPAEIREDAYNVLADLINDILKPLGGSCYVQGEEVVVKAARETHRRPLPL